MSNIHGKNAVIYLGAAGAAAINISEMADWSLDMDVATAETSQLNQTWKEFVKGMLGYSFTFNGNFNPASVQLWNAVVSSVAEKWYLYPSILVTTSYYYGTAWIQFNKIAAGSTSAKASTGIKGVGTGALSYNG